MRAILGLVLAAVLSAGTSPADEPRYDTAARPQPLPFSDAVRAGGLLFVSGQLGVGDDLKLVPGGIAAETRQIMARIKAIVERNGGSMSRVVKCTCMLADMREWAAMNEVYVTYFPPDRLPARSAFGAAGLALGARVEIECIAALS